MKLKDVILKSNDKIALTRRKEKPVNIPTDGKQIQDEEDSHTAYSHRQCITDRDSLIREFNITFTHVPGG